MRYPDPALLRPKTLGKRPSRAAQGFEAVHGENLTIYCDLTNPQPAWLAESGSVGAPSDILVEREGEQFPPPPPDHSSFQVK